jgi:glyoxylase-like metal-dependent hydrolase (beta-lactamase superfamily II)
MPAADRSSSYVVGEAAPVVIDPGPEDEGHLRRVVEACMARPALIVCTHSHPDLAGAACSRTLKIPARRPAPDDGYQTSLRAEAVDGDRLATDAGDLRVRTPRARLEPRLPAAGIAGAPV